MLNALLLPLSGAGRGADPGAGLGAGPGAGFLE